MFKSNIFYPLKRNNEMLVLDVFWMYYVSSIDVLSAEGMTVAIPLY